LTPGKREHLLARRYCTALPVCFVALASRTNRSAERLRDGATCGNRGPPRLFAREGKPMTAILLIRSIRPTLSDGNAAFHRGFSDARYGAERPRITPADPAYRCYMLGWVEGSIVRAEAVGVVGN